MKIRLLFPTLLLAALLAGPVAQAADPAPKPGGTLNFLVEPEPPVLTTLVNTAGPILKVNAKVIEGLLGYDFSMQPIPQLATRWSVSPDGKQYTFILRQGVKWHDGQDFTSADVAFSIMTVKQYNSRGQGTFASVTGVQTPDPYTAVVQLSQPAPYLISAFSANEAPMIPGICMRVPTLSETRIIPRRCRSMTLTASRIIPSWGLKPGVMATDRPRPVLSLI